MRLADFDYELPAELIAQHPAAERAASRLMHVDGATGAIEDRSFRDLVGLVRPGDVLVFNDTKVIKARLHGRKDSGGAVEILVERVLDASRALALVRSSKPPRPGRRIVLARGGSVEVLERRGELYELLFLDGPVLDVLEAWARSRCPPTSRIPPAPRTSGATRRSTHACRGRWPRRPRDCTSTSRRSTRCARRTWRSRASPCTWARARSSRCAWKIRRRT